MMQSFVIKCANEAQTENLAKKMAALAQPKDVFLLEGTLGAGKSVFARAFIQALTEAKEVPSPTFTLVQTYLTPSFEIYHFDLYRLKSPEEIWELNIEEAFSSAVSLVEWPDKMGPYVPRTSIKIKISIEEDKSRVFTIDFPTEFEACRYQAAIQDDKNVHATTVDVNGNGVLIFGASGSGKSDLALRLIENKNAVLVSDDQTNLENKDGDLIASAPKTIEGLLEVRGMGIVSVPVKEKTRVKLIVFASLKEEIERYPSNSFFKIKDVEIKSMKLDLLEPSAPDKIVLKLKTILEEEKQNA